MQTNSAEWSCFECWVGSHKGISKGKGSCCSQHSIWTLNGFSLFPNLKHPSLHPFQANDGCEKVSGHDNQVPNPLVFLMKIHHWAREYGNDLQQKPLEFSSWNFPTFGKNRKKITGSTKRQLLLVKWHWAMKPRSHRVVSQRCRSSFKNPSRMVFSQGKLQKLPNVPQGGGDPWRQLRIESIEESHFARH